METKRVCLFVFLCLGIKIKQIMENLKTNSQKLRNAPLTTELTVDPQVSYMFAWCYMFRGVSGCRHAQWTCGSAPCPRTGPGSVTY